MSKLNILLLDNSHLPLVGGKEIVVHHLARQYQQLGHKVTVAGPGGFWKHRNVKLGYPVKRFPSLSWINTDQRWSLRSNLIFGRGEYDVAHSHTTYPSGYHSQRWLERHSNRTPLVVTPHGADIHKVPEQNWGKRLDEATDRKIRWLLERCDATTAISDSVYDSLLEAGAPRSKVHHIANGVDTERMQHDGGVDARAHFGLPNDCPFLISVGNYKKIKGHDVIVDALAQCNAEHMRLVLVGNTSEEFVAKTAAGPVADRVIFTGPLKFPITGQTQGPDLLAALLQQSTAYVSASVGEGAEGLSLALLEAMAAGTCAVATDISGNRDQVKHRENGLLVAPANAAAMAAAFDVLIDQPDLTEQMSAAAQTSVAGMSWRNIANKYIALYQQLISEKEPVTQ